MCPPFAHSGAFLHAPACSYRQIADCFGRCLIDGGAVGCRARTIRSWLHGTPARFEFQEFVAVGGGEGVDADLIDLVGFADRYA